MLYFRPWCCSNNSKKNVIHSATPLFCKTQTWLSERNEEQGKDGLKACKIYGRVLYSIGNEIQASQEFSVPRYFIVVCWSLDTPLPSLFREESVLTFFLLKIPIGLNGNIKNSKISFSSYEYGWSIVIYKRYETFCACMPLDAPNWQLHWYVNNAIVTKWLTSKLQSAEERTAISWDNQCPKIDIGTDYTPINVKLGSSDHNTSFDPRMWEGFSFIPALRKVLGTHKQKN